jgi:hypothetical protein
MTLMGCSNKDVIKHKYYFKGEGNLWDAYYQEKSVETYREIDGILDYDCDTESTFTAVYKNDLSDLVDVKKIEVGYDAGSFGSTLTENYIENGPDKRAFIIKSTSGLVSNEAGIIKVSISIDGKTETFELQSQ